MDYLMLANGYRLRWKRNPISFYHIRIAAERGFRDIQMRRAVGQSRC